jgi:nucleoside-diphosphate kinase
MATNRTFTMIKPDAVDAGNTGAIIKMIEEAGFRIVAMKKTQLTKERAGQFYEVHNERPFYNDLTAYMSSGAIVPMILEKENAVEDFRKLIGATDPTKAAPGTIRNLFAKSIEANAIHGSDSNEIKQGAVTQALWPARAAWHVQQTAHLLPRQQGLGAALYLGRGDLACDVLCNAAGFLQIAEKALHSSNFARYC